MIGSQSEDWAFDVTTYSSIDSKLEHIACEVKKSVAETDDLVERMTRFGRLPNAERMVTPKAKEMNAFKKLRALRSRRPPLFWAVGPTGLSYAFRMGYSEEGVVSFQQIPIQELRYQRGSLSV